jgi:hypothetical protein
MMLPLFEQVKFLHPVGVSTCKYGVSIPLEAQTPALQSIAKGSKVPVTILCDGMEPVLSDIRRLNNKPGHLQFRYELKAQERLRQYLGTVFEHGKGGSLLNIEEIAPWTFRFQPILKSAAPFLQISDMLLHRLKKQDASRFAELKQIKESLGTIAYDAGFSQTDYNSLIRSGLEDRGWQSEQRVIKELGLKCDFEKNGVWVEVEFGNARSYYQDYVKFMLAHKYRDARLGLLLCPTTSFAALLCELGRQRARENSVAERAPVYSGMMSYEKAVRELPYLGFMFEMPIVVAGVGVMGN